jgi:hypothetical protein
VHVAGEQRRRTNYQYLVGEAEPTFGNCWHFPTNVEPGTVTMRNPTNPTPGADTYVYVGNYQPDADMTGGKVYYKKSTAGSWSTNSLSYDSTSGDNNYWKAAIPSNAVALGETLQYYVEVDYANGGADTTFLGTTNQTGQVKYAQATNAAAHPFQAVSAANLGNCWHVPTNAEPAGAYMRNPRHPYASNAVTFYNGNQFQGAGNAADQSGGWLLHRLQGTGTWTSNALAFDSQAENNKYWAATIASGTFGKTQTVEYVLAVTYTDRDATYVGATGIVSRTFAALAEAQAAPFTFTYGDDPGWSRATLARRQRGQGGGRCHPDLGQDRLRGDERLSLGRPRRGALSHHHQRRQQADGERRSRLSKLATPKVLSSDLV